MKNNYVYLDSETFEIQKECKLIAVDSRLAKTISILNKKGYHIKLYANAKISKPLIISELINNLVKEKALDFKIDKDKIQKAIKPINVENVLISFGEDYAFDNLPQGFIYQKNDLYYSLSCLNDNINMSFKSAVELDKELNDCIKDLEIWAENLQNRD